MEYLVHDNYQLNGKQLVVCKDGNSNKCILNKVSYVSKWLKFDVSKFKRYGDSVEIKNDENIYYNEYTGQLWQVCGIASDMNGVFIDNCYQVRHIGLVFLY